MENYMKNFYIILILFFSFTIYSCAKKNDSSSSSSTTELEGTWQTPCHLPEGESSYYRIKKLTVSGTNWADRSEYYSDSSCATEYDLWLRTFGSLSIGDATEVSGVSGHKFTMTHSENTYTPQTSGGVSWSNTNSYCDLTGWELNTAQDVAGKTCGAGTDPMLAIGVAGYGTYLLDGSKLFWEVSSSTYPSRVRTGDNDTFTKQ
jgi:hypothetical protein